VTNIDKQRVAAVRRLGALRYSDQGGEWVPPAAAAPQSLLMTTESEAMYDALMRRADALEDCTLGVLAPSLHDHKRGHLRRSTLPEPFRVITGRVGDGVASFGAHLFPKPRRQPIERTYKKVARAPPRMRRGARRSEDNHCAIRSADIVRALPGRNPLAVCEDDLYRLPWRKDVDIGTPTHA